MHFPRLVFPYEFDLRIQHESRERGLYGPAVVEMADGRRFSVHFFDHIRLGQELANARAPRYISEPGMIVLEEVTYENMLSSVRALASCGYFEFLKPLDDELFRKTFPLLQK